MTAMRLAEVTGRVDVDEMLAELSPRAFAEWCAKDRVEPIGMNGACHILAKIGEMIAHFMGGKVTQRDFMPWLSEPVAEPQQLTPAQSRAAVMAELKRAAGGI